jgi:transcriptional regulator with XRE-family HTH domain
MTVKFILAEVRTQRGMTQEELAQAMGMSLGGIQYWEYQATSVKLDELDRLCEVLKCEPGNLFKRYKDDIDEQNRLNREKRRQLKSERMKQWWAQKRKQQSKQEKENAA